MGYDLLAVLGQNDILEQIAVSLPPGVRVIVYYLLDARLWLFGSVALLGSVMFIVSLRRVALLSWRDINSAGLLRGFRHRANLRRTRQRAAAVKATTLAPRFRFAQRIAGVFAGGVFVLGLIITIAVYYVVSNVLRDQAEQRTLAMATNLSDAAVMRVLAKDRGALKALLLRYVQLGNLAYAVVQDRNAKILAHTFNVIPVEVEQSMSKGDLRAPRNKTNLYQGREVYEVRVPLLHGKHGAVHLGFWQSAVDGSVSKSLRAIMGLMLVVLLAAIMAAILFARKITAPVLKVTRAAARISHGELDSPVGVATKDEVGEIAYSVERMRSSLKAVTMRLERS